MDTKRKRTSEDTTAEQCSNTAETRDAAGEAQQLLNILQQGEELPGKKETIRNAPNLGMVELHGSLYVRSCYLELANQLENFGTKRRMCVTGDQGAGKSVFAIYMFLRLAKKGEKVVLVTQSGRVFQHDPEQTPAVSDHWDRQYLDTIHQLWAKDGAKSKWWLLLDGSAPVSTVTPYTAKPARAVVFAAPKKENYQDFMKSSGMFLYMPCWDWSEIKTLAGEIYVEKWRFGREDGEDDEEKGTCLDALLSFENKDFRDQARQLDSMSQSDLAAFDRGDMLHVAEARFLLVGGRMNWITSSRFSLVQLRKKARLSAEDLVMDQLFRPGKPEIGGKYPTLAYSITPTCSYFDDDPESYTEFELKFGSDFASHCVSRMAFKRSMETGRHLF